MINKTSWKLALIHVLSEVATCFNIIVVMVYWPFLHKEAMEHFSKQPVHPQWKCFHMYLIHSFPAIANVMILYTTNIRFAAQHWWAFIPVTLAYSATNYAGTIYIGKPLYPFLDWKDFKTPLIIVGMAVFFAGFFVLLAKVRNHSVTTGKADAGSERKTSTRRARSVSKSP